MPALRIFLVEDNEIIRESMREMLQEINSVEVVGWAECECEAVDRLCGGAIGWDLAILDLFLKDGSGLGVLSRCGPLLRANPSQRCIVVSNYVNDEVRQSASTLGATRVFDKSNDVAALVEYVAFETAARVADDAAVSIR